MAVRLGIWATIGFTMVMLAVTAMLGFVLAHGFFGWLSGDAATLLPGISVLDASPKLQSWATLLAVQFSADELRADLLAAVQWLVLLAVGLGVLAGYLLPELMRLRPSLAGFPLRQTYELWLQKVERRWFAIGVLAVVILFEVLRTEAFSVTPQEAAPYFDVNDVWFDLTPLIFAGFLLAQVAIVRRRAGQLRPPPLGG